VVKRGLAKETVVYPYSRICLRLSWVLVRRQRSGGLRFQALRLYIKKLIIKKGWSGSECRPDPSTEKERKKEKKNAHMKFFLLLFYCCAGWEYIGPLTKILTIYHS
jgi:fatty acid desaturase